MTTSKQHMASIAAMPCLVCGARSTVHHVTSTRSGGRISRSDYLTAPLCAKHHQIQHGPYDSVEALGHAGFYERHNIDLLDWALRHAPAEFWRDNARRLRDPVFRQASLNYAERIGDGL
jgi:hypothetical protein